jgi:hypothetical protein
LGKGAKKREREREGGRKIQLKWRVFHPARMRLILSITPSQIDFALKRAPNGRPRYFIGKEETMHHKILANLLTLLTLPT